MQLLTPYQQRFEGLLDQYWQTRSIEPSLKAAMMYATTNGGKRFRPALIWMTGEALNVPLEQLDAAALAIELIHCYSLVHDDLPAMDDDDLRRGKPTVHIAFDEATAILAGDALLTEAFELLAHADILPDSLRLRQIALLSHAAGSQGMVAGQMMDMAATGGQINLDTLRTLHERKTGYLIRCALLLGASPSATYTELTPLLSDLGLTLGLLFQVQDDILDVEQTTEQLGKPAGSDAEQNKCTYPALMGLEEARAWREALRQHCHDLLSALPFSSNTALRQLVDLVADRTH